MLFWAILIVAIAGILGGFVLWRKSAERVQLKLESKAEVLDKWYERCPEHPASSVILEPSGFAALVDLEDGGTGILWIYRKAVVGRVLQQGEVQETGSQLRIEIPESSERFLIITIQEPMVRRIWLETLKTVLTEAPKG